ncbi:MAG: hypothetical protein ACLFSC_04080, partial [Wenzhouxiangella sp.]
MSDRPLSRESLQWTRPMLEELCIEVRNCLESWADQASAERDQLLEQATEACGKVHRSLSVLNFESGDLMAQAMRDALIALETEGTDIEQTVQTVLEATAILPDFLDYVEASGSDQIGLILPVINDLRVAAGQEALDKADFFPVQLRGVRPPAAETDGSASFPELRREFQLALRNYLTGGRSAEQFAPVGASLMRIRNHPLLPNGLRRLAWALAGLAELIAEGQLTFSADVSRHFSRLDGLLKEVCGEADELTIGNRADSAVRAVLFQVASAAAATPLTEELAFAFSFDKVASEPELQASVFLAGHSRDLTRAVTEAAQSDLARIKDTLGSQLESDRDPAVLEQQTELLESVGASLAMIGLDALGQRIVRQARRLSSVGSNVDDPTLLEVARELLVVESSLAEGFSAATRTPSEEDDDDSSLTLLPASELQRIVRHLIRESIEDLAHARHLLDGLARGKDEGDAASETSAILQRIAGAVHMAGLDDSGHMLEAAERLVRDQFGSNVAEPAPEALAALAEALTVIEFHLEAIASSDPGRTEGQFAAARNSLRALGYWPEPEPEPEPEP